MPKEIIVTVSDEGEVEIKTTGYKGADCLNDTKALKEALGQTTKVTPTAEMHSSHGQSKNASR